MLDSTFKQFLSKASQADMPLFRGMFLKATLSEPLVREPSASPMKRSRPGSPSSAPAVLSLAVQQAFLPKFENEGQDTSIANAIVSSAEERYMAITVKHSGSLATLSHNLMGAKNSINNSFCEAAVILLRAHYNRLPAATCALAFLWHRKPTKIMIEHGFLLLLVGLATLGDHPRCCGNGQERPNPAVAGKGSIFK